MAAASHENSRDCTSRYHARYIIQLCVYTLVGLPSPNSRKRIQLYGIVKNPEVNRGIAVDPLGLLRANLLDHSELLAAILLEFLVLNLVEYLAQCLG